MNALSTQNPIVLDTQIRRDNDGRYCLNDLHKASGGLARHKPSEWLRNKQTQELIAEIAKAGIPALEQNQALNIVHGGNKQGVYVAKELVYAFAMWISPAFHLKVIRAFDAMVNGQELSDQQLDLIVQRVRQALLPALSASVKRGFYTPEEDAVIREKRALGWGARRISRVLNRSMDSVAHRVRRMEV